jgi:hypothetical protein
MKRLVIYIITFLMVGATGCNRREEEAKARLDYAKSLYEQQEFAAAKSEIDSIRALYPTEVKTLKEALVLMRRVEMKEAERNIAFCDSLLPIRQEEAKAASKGFVFEKDSAYEEIGNYIWKQQTVERNVERSYIRCGVNEKGEIYLTSVYFGSRPISHTGIKLSVGNSLFAETASVPYDGGINYRFTDNGNMSEIVIYKGENGIDAVKFVCANAKERIKADYIGGKTYAIYLADADKQAIVTTYELAVILSDIEKLTAERGKSLERKAYLEGKLNP